MVERRAPSEGPLRPAMAGAAALGALLVVFGAIPVAPLLGGAVSEPPAPELRHLELRSSVPAADSIVSSPPEIRLGFTEVPLYQTTTIRLLDASGALVPTGETTRAPDDGRVYFVAIGRPLPPGPYTVAWRTLAADGHAVTAEFRFTVRRD